MTLNFFKLTPKRLVEKELDESQRFLLQAQTNKEHWEAQVSYFQTKIKRLKVTWNAMSTEEEKIKSLNGKDKDD
jgi:hypothetical protein